MPATPFHTDLLVVGGGPAGCAAARMAASVGMRSILIEPDTLCRNLYRIPALNNVLGGYTSGPEFADAVTAELTSTGLCRIELGRRVTDLRVTDGPVPGPGAEAALAPDPHAPDPHAADSHAPDPHAPDPHASSPHAADCHAPVSPAPASSAPDGHVTVTLDTGACLTAPYAVVATGVGPLQPGDVPWIDAPTALTLPPLWQADAAEAEGRTLLVLGGDRPIGTFLRAHPTVATRLLVAHPAADAYKTEEVRDDPRVTLLPVERLVLRREQGASAVTAETVGPRGERRSVSADAAYLSIGNAPTAPAGDLVRGADGYCPPGAQHPRVIVAGDLRSARFQRIMTALGSGSEAALQAYYAARDLPA
ncbi:pyridine nucleotide-disulfide oxidoreductase [Streptomyces sp. NPDC048018]|uniref:pyridine nucleotide-disulfide oxidoreductase n=1 Tax=Streptomyces sp. NPDC048018 TaxID=3365499 RepID=UPI003711277A